MREEAFAAKQNFWELIYNIILPLEKIIVYINGKILNIKDFKMKTS